MVGTNIVAGATAAGDIGHICSQYFPLGLWITYQSLSINAIWPVQNCTAWW